MSTFGKYRGQVANNVDPLQLGRLQVTCPAVLGSGRMSWAMPSVPYAGPGVGFFAIPPGGANIWVEFEGGDPDYPIWSGCFWGAGQMPALPAVAEMKVFKTEGVTLTFSDVPGAGGLTIEVGPPVVQLPMKLQFSAHGIEIALAPGSIKLAPGEVELAIGAASVKLSPASVNVNNGALEVI